MSKSKPSRSPDLFGDIEKWVEYFDNMNEDQMHFARQRLNRIDRVYQVILQRRQNQKAFLWEQLR